jgi:hypothetical protein
MIEMAGSKKEKEASSERGCLKTKAENAIKNLLLHCSQEEYPIVMLRNATFHSKPSRFTRENSWSSGAISL